MKNWKNLGGSLVLATLLGSTAARAEVTADQVWQGWVDYYGKFGASVTTGSKGMEGDTLVVSNAVFGSTTPNGSFSATLAEVRMKELGDGRVEVTIPAEIPFVINGKDAAGKVTDIGMTVSQTGMSLIASGSPEALSYDFSAPEMGVKLTSAKTDGTDLPLSVTMAMTGNSGKYQVVKQGGSAISSDFKTDKVTFDVSGADPAGTGKFTMAGTLNALAGQSTMTLPDGIDFTNMAAALTAGMDVKADMTFGQGDYTFDMADGEQTMNGSVSGGGGNFKVDMSKAGLTYAVGGTSAKVSMTGSQIPFPVDLSYGETAFNLTMPVTKSEEAQPFALLMKVVDLSVSDGIWGMIDPTAQLPHDPATLVVDVSGAVKLLVDILDPANAENPPAMPGEVQSVNLNSLQVKAVGAELGGTGAVSFDNSGGMPKPIGAVDLKLTGANALIDKLVAMGLIPQDQAAGAKMMMGMFAVPAGEDVLTSKIEFKDDGGIYANGQRLQ